MMKKLLLSIVSFFGIGLISKKAPGTVASACGALLLALLPRSSIGTAIATIAFWIIGTVACDLYIVRYKYDSDPDPKYVVIDEICGLFAGAALLYSFGLNSLFTIIIHFLLFRVFDILKPFPIRNIEKICKQNPKTVGLGIMLDDIIAGVAAALIQLLFIILYRL